MSKAVERALISVSDKTGIVDFARALADRGVELLSTGGTFRAIQEAFINSGLLGCQDLTSCEFKRAQRRRRRLRV